MGVTLKTASTKPAKHAAYSLLFDTSYRNRIDKSPLFHRHLQSVISAGEIFLSCLCGSELVLLTLDNSQSFLSCLCGSELD